jgi:hypothetical protein
MMHAVYKGGVRRYAVHPGALRREHGNSRPHQMVRQSVKSYPNAPEKNNRTRPNTPAKTRPGQQAAEQRESHLGYWNPSMTSVDALLVLRAAKRMTLAVGLILQ